VKQNIEKHCKVILELVKAFLPVKDLGHKYDNVVYLYTIILQIHPIARLQNNKQIKQKQDNF
jgi:hypothetical protein